MTHHRRRTAVRTYPSELEIVTARMFDAPIGLVFDVLRESRSLAPSMAARKFHVH